MPLPRPCSDQLNETFWRSTESRGVAGCPGAENNRNQGKGRPEDEAVLPLAMEPVTGRWVEVGEGF